jgi:hypothetical protein
LQRSFSFALSGRSSRAALVSPVISTWCRRYLDARSASSSGFLAYPALVRFRSSKAAVLTMRMPPGLRSARCTLRAAGFIATSASS